jgi:cell cycle arrest protein BUB2
MNVLLAPFLYVMPSELEAFHCFCQFIEQCCPTYVQPSLAGVHNGLKVRLNDESSITLAHRGSQLLDRCLQIADPTLFDHLKTKGLNAELYGFACE